MTAITAELVAELLNDAKANDYDLSKGWTDEEIATDLICYADECSDATVDHLRPFVRMWLLRTSGYIIGPRDPRLNTDFAGSLMVVEAHEASELPTKDGRNGPWCIVGNDPDKLLNEAFEHYLSLLPALDAAEALQIVIDLARNNVVNEEELPDEHARQVEAIRVVEDMAVNQFGD